MYKMIKEEVIFMLVVPILFMCAIALGCLLIYGVGCIVKSSTPTIEQCETILNQNPGMCLSVCVDEWANWSC